jgi:hypothetical protein
LPEAVPVATTTWLPERARATAAAAIEAASAARERATRAARELREAEDRIPAGH